MKRKKIQKKLKFEGKSLEFLHSDADITVLIASRGCGKSIVSSYLTAKKLTMGESGILMAPTYRDCVSILLRNVINILDQQGFVEGKHFVLDKQLLELYLLDEYGQVKSYCVFRSADNPDCARGVSDVNFFIMDEAVVCKKMAFDATVPVLRGGDVDKTQIFLIVASLSDWFAYEA